MIWTIETLNVGGSGLVGLGSASPSSCSSSACSKYTGMMEDVRVWDTALTTGVHSDIMGHSNLYEPSFLKVNNLKAGRVHMRIQAAFLNPT